MGIEQGKIDEILSSFSCEKDTDIEGFLKTRAIEFERIGKSRTFLLFENEAFGRTPILLGYFSLALKILYIADEASNRKRKELDGFSGKLDGKPIEAIPCYLIGQIGRNSNVDKSKISGNEIMEYAMSAIGNANDIVGGRCVLLECKDITKQIQFYETNGFQKYDAGQNHYVQMIRLLY